MTDKIDTKARIEQLQKWLLQEGFDFFLLPRSDRYGQEFLPACNERIAWLTGFTGSSGFVVITPSECVLFSDKRYTIQMETQTPDNVTCHDGSADDIRAIFAKNDNKKRQNWLSAMAIIDTATSEICRYYKRA